MPAELPFAPVDGIIRRNAEGLRVSAEATERLADRIEDHGAALAVEAATLADRDGRKTLMAEDFGISDIPDRDELALPIAPVDRIARRDIDDRYRVSMDARIALASLLELDADRIAEAARTLARHADRRTITAGDIETYFAIPDRE